MILTLGDEVVDLDVALRGVLAALSGVLGDAAFAGTAFTGTAFAGAD